MCKQLWANKEVHERSRKRGLGRWELVSERTSCRFYFWPQTGAENNFQHVGEWPDRNLKGKACRRLRYLKSLNSFRSQLHASSWTHRTNDVPPDNRWTYLSTEIWVPQKHHPTVSESSPSEPEQIMNGSSVTIAQFSVWTSFLYLVLLLGKVIGHLIDFHRYADDTHFHVFPQNLKKIWSLS